MVCGSSGISGYAAFACSIVEPIPIPSAVRMSCDGKIIASPNDLDIYICTSLFWVSWYSVQFGAPGCCAATLSSPVAMACSSVMPSLNGPSPPGPSTLPTAISCELTVLGTEELGRDDGGAVVREPLDGGPDGIELGGAVTVTVDGTWLTVSVSVGRATCTVRGRLTPSATPPATSAATVSAPTPATATARRRRARRAPATT